MFGGDSSGYGAGLRRRDQQCLLGQRIDPRIGKGSVEADALEAVP